MEAMYNKDLILHAIKGINQNLIINRHGRDSSKLLFMVNKFQDGEDVAFEWLEENIGIYKAFRTIWDYEEISSDNKDIDLLVEPENICNYYAFIVGTVMLRDCEHIVINWEKRMTKADLKMIHGELEQIYYRH